MRPTWFYYSQDNYKNHQSRRQRAYAVPARCRQEGSLRRPEKRIPYTKLDFSCRPQGDPTTDYPLDADCC